MRGLCRIESTTGVAEPPENFVKMQARSDLDLTAGRGGLDGVADENIREVPQGVGVGPGGRHGFIDLAREPDSSRGTFLLEVTNGFGAALAGTGRPFPDVERSLQPLPDSLLAARGSRIAPEGIT